MLRKFFCIKQLLFYWGELERETGIQKFSLRQMSETDLPPGQRTGTETYF